MGTTAFLTSPNEARDFLVSTYDNMLAQFKLSEDEYNALVSVAWSAYFDSLTYQAQQFVTGSEAVEFITGYNPVAEATDRLPDDVAQYLQECADNIPPLDSETREKLLAIYSAGRVSAIEAADVGVQGKDAAETVAKTVTETADLADPKKSPLIPTLVGMGTGYTIGALAVFVGVAAPVAIPFAVVGGLIGLATGSVGARIAEIREGK